MNVINVFVLLQSTNKLKGDVIYFLCQRSYILYSYELINDYAWLNLCNGSIHDTIHFLAFLHDDFGEQ